MRLSALLFIGICSSLVKSGIAVDFEVEPPPKLKQLMLASEQERNYRIGECKKSIREVLNQANASVVEMSTLARALDGKASVVAAVKSTGIRLTLSQLGTLRQAEEDLRTLRDLVFVRPVLREFVPNQMGMIHNATVIRIYDDMWDQTITNTERPLPADWKRLLVETADGTRMIIKSFPGELAAEGKPLANPGTIYITTGYTKYDDHGETKTLVVAEILFVPELQSYLKKLKQVRDALKDPSFRLWTIDNNDYKLCGKFIGFSRGAVHIRKPDGTVVQVSMSDLALDDQQHVRAKLKEK